MARKKPLAKKPSERALAPAPRKAPTRVAASADPPRCGLCGKATNLVRTECCDNWICDDEGNYQLFSYAHNSCHRNHRRYTLCGSHFCEGHEGRWQDCAKCREDVETEMYVYYGTNEYNFETLEKPPKYKPTKCRTCGKIIPLGDGGYVQSSEGYFCMKCSNVRL